MSPKPPPSPPPSPPESPPDQQAFDRFLPSADIAQQCQNSNGGSVPTPDEVQGVTLAISENDERNKENRNAREERRKEQKRYANRLFNLIAIWLVGVFILLALSGGEIEVCGRVIGVKFSDTVLVTYLTTTTVTVLGLFVIVAKWLFPSLQEDDDEAEGDR
ncbi:MAG: hypothetical protein LBT53_05450 [Puniceicoccales bacterium]|jgi:hypothetical protein|nr:hypothetical protein [Puniceicoccales bacterium]